jgi:hypothetical protein
MGSPVLISSSPEPVEPPEVIFIANKNGTPVEVPIDDLWAYKKDAMIQQPETTGENYA